MSSVGISLFLYLRNCRISVDSLRRHTPDQAVYRSAAAHLGVAPGALRLIAAHAWDVFGAMKAGWKAAFVARKGAPLCLLGPKPDLIAPDMKGIANALEVACDNRCNQAVQVAQ